MSNSPSVNLLDFGLSAMESWVLSLGEPKFRATQLIAWIHQRRVTDFAKMTNLSKSFRAQLTQSACIRFPEVAYESCSKDGTIKWLFRLTDGNCIETVFIPEPKRATLCVSSQVGCALNCSFCATGKEGFNRNLTVGEIIGQLWMAQERIAALGRTQRVSNVVMMGMGEPLLNYDAVLAAMDLMLNDMAYGLSKYRGTLSSSGVVPMIERLKADSDVSLAISLHAANDELRSQLVPINTKYPLAKLMAVCQSYYEDQPKREVTYEYVMLAGVNDSLADARQLVKLLSGGTGKVNLIPFNPFDRANYTCSPWPVIERFQAHLVAAGINTRVRRTRGDDIDAACGQLAGDIEDRTGRHARWQQTGRLIPVVDDR